MKNRFIRIIFFTQVFLTLAGCTEKYRLGYPGGISSKSLAIEVVNRSLAPQMGPSLNRAIKNELLKSGVYQIVNKPENAKMQVLVTLENYRQYAQAYNPEDTLLASGFELHIRARVEVKNRSNKINRKSFYLDTRAYALRSRSLEKPKDRQVILDMSRELGSRIASRLMEQSY